MIVAGIVLGAAGVAVCLLNLDVLDKRHGWRYLAGAFMFALGIGLISGGFAATDADDARQACEQRGGNFYREDDTQLCLTNDGRVLR